MYIPLGNVHHGRLGSAVINPFDGQIGLWKYGFSDTEKMSDDERRLLALEEEKEPHLVTPSSPRSIYNGYGAFDGTGSTIAGGIVGALMAVGVLAAMQKISGSPDPLIDELKENWYCIAGGAALIMTWEMLSGIFR